jgi:diacylglycerol kinase family enzyme
MRVTVLYRESAGQGLPVNQLRSLIEEQGHTIVGLVEMTGDPRRVLEGAAELVVAAGGDGTVSTAAKVLAGHGIPLAVLPLGTANNIAGSLGIAGPTAELISDWRTARRYPLDLAAVSSGAWDGGWFVEAAGCGLIPAAIAAIDAEPALAGGPAAKLRRAVERYSEILSGLAPLRSTLTIDGARITGEFLLVEVLNTRAVGPNLVLAPDASPSDGFLSVVVAAEGERRELAEYLQSRIDGRECRLRLPARRAREVTIEPCDLLHVDDEVRRAPAGRMSIRIAPAALEYLASPFRRSRRRRTRTAPVPCRSAAARARRRA